jgi:hypothetical protein
VIVKGRDMGNLFEREYYRVSAAAAEIGCDVDDLIHWAATGRLSLGVLYEIHAFDVSDYKYISSKQIIEGTTPDSVDDFNGFVYVDTHNFQDMERLGGDLRFSMIRLMNGRAIMRRPPRMETRSLDQIYIHSNDLRKLLASGTPATSGKAIYSTPTLAILNASVNKFFEPRREKDAKRDEVVEWIKEQMKAAKMPDSDNVAAAIFTIIKPVDHDPRRRRG